MVHVSFNANSGGAAPRTVNLGQDREAKDTEGKVKRLHFGYFA